jgi:hypothetical protein
MRGALPLFSLYVFMEWTRVTSAFTEHLLSLESIRDFIIIIIIITIIIIIIIIIEFPTSQPQLGNIHLSWDV